MCALFSSEILKGGAVKGLNDEVCVCTQATFIDPLPSLVPRLKRPRRHRDSWELPPTQKAPLNGLAPHITRQRGCSALSVSIHPYRLTRKRVGICSRWFSNVHCTRIAFTRKGVDLRRMVLIFSVPVSLLRGYSFVCGLVAIASLLRVSTFYRLLERLRLRFVGVIIQLSIMSIYTPACYGRG